MAGSPPPSNVGDGARLVRTGEVVSGKFRIERVLGQGGMGVVVAAKHLQLDETVALKFLRAHASSDPDALARFAREARAAAKLKSEHVARVLDAGIADDGTPYIVMEYLEGRTLGRVLEDQGRLDVATAAEYAIQTCEGLAEAHARGIVHRDIKPENLFLVERSQGWRVLKILDFGISKFDVARGAPDANIATQSMMGSPCYMSPEQLRSTATVDHRTDIWSLGATLFELIAGGTAYRAGQSLPQLIAAILEQPTPRLVDIWPDVPAELSAVVARCMTKDREERFGSAAELALALLPFAPKRVRANVERAIAVTQSAAPSSRPIELWSDRPPPSRSAQGGAAAGVPVSGTLRSATSRKVAEVVDNLDTLAAPTVPVSEEKARRRIPPDCPRSSPRGPPGGPGVAPHEPRIDAASQGVHADGDRGPERSPLGCARVTGSRHLARGAARVEPPRAGAQQHAVGSRRPSGPSGRGASIALTVAAVRQLAVEPRHPDGALKRTGRPFRRAPSRIMISRKSRRFALLALAIGTAVLGRGARADDLADEAELQFEIGADRYKAGDFRGALEHFLASNRLAANRNVVFNIARAYEQLGQNPDAYRYYNQALTGEQDPAARARIADAIARIEPLVAVLDVDSDPPGATISDHASRPRRPGEHPGDHRPLAGTVRRLRRPAGLRVRRERAPGPQGGDARAPDHDAQADRRRPAGRRHSCRRGGPSGRRGSSGLHPPVPGVGRAGTSHAVRFGAGLSDEGRERQPRRGKHRGRARRPLAGDGDPPRGLRGAQRARDRRRARAGPDAGGPRASGRRS